ncbi:HdeD family acid-resistance protein [Myxosarcina sp. GI1(2024)]
MNNPNNRPVEDFTTWIFILGVLLILLGLGAIVLPLLAPEAVGLILAWVFLISGLIRIVYAFQSRPSPGLWLKLSTGILNEVASLLLFTKLIQPYLSLSMLLGIIILAKGLLEVAMVSSLRPGSARNWMLMSGVISIGLGTLFIVNRKLGAAWLLGLLVGASLIVSGI